MDSVRWGANYLLDCRIGDEQYVAQVSQGSAATCVYFGAFWEAYEERIP